MGKRPCKPKEHTEKPTEPCKQKEPEIPIDPCPKRPENPCGFLTKNKCNHDVKPKSCDEDKTSKDDKPTAENQDDCTCSGDLYFIGKAWIDVLRCGLLGVDWNVVPIVEAADVKPVYPKPPKMGFKDLPLYTSPHYDYKSNNEEDIRCPKAKEKLGHQYVLPIVKSYRSWASQNWSDFKDEVSTMKKEAKGNFIEKKLEFIKFMRDPNNLLVRSATVALGGISGYCISSGKLAPRRIFYTGAGLLAAGALCFPEETDNVVRNVAYSTGKFVVSIYNKCFGANIVLKDKLPCSSEMPGEFPPRTANFCPENEKFKKKLLDEYSIVSKLKQEVLQVHKQLSDIDDD